MTSIRSEAPALRMRGMDGELIGISADISRLRQDIAEVASADARALITGETGVGKDLIAHVIHRSGRRATHPYVRVNCATLTEPLLEAELFGDARSRLPGGSGNTEGSFERAHGGTVLLDGIDALSPRMQAALLHFLDTSGTPPGEAVRASRRIDVRIIAATSHNLAHSVARGEFREDLFYRLNVVHLVVPPLRDRSADVPLLVEHFLGRLRAIGHSGLTAIAPDAMQLLCAYAWPGNVRELRHLIEWLAVSEHDVLQISHLPPSFRGASSSPGDWARFERTVTRPS